MNVLVLCDEGLARAVHGMLPTREASEVVPERQWPIAQCASVALSPHHALDIGWLKLPMNTEYSAVTIDNDLGVKQRIAVGDTFADAQVDGYTGPATGILDGTHILSVRLHHDALFGVFCQSSDLL